MNRILIFGRDDTFKAELNDSEVFELTRTEEVNGEHSLTIVTSRLLEKGQRVLFQDATGTWREYVVWGVDGNHDEGEHPIGTYYCVWSLQPDLMGTQVSAMPGVQTPCDAATALAAALGGTDRWDVGTVTNTNTGGASMYDTDGWSAMSTLIETWGGEIDAVVSVANNSGVSARQVYYYAQMGSATAVKRFDFGADLKAVRRTIEDGALYCRISPRGMGEMTESGGYGRRITIESVNSGLDYLENAEMVDIAKLPDGQGGWEYPTLIVENDECETPADLKAWAQSVLTELTTPQISYEVDALLLKNEGMNANGVKLGDAVQVVDRKFWNGLRLDGRVMALTVDELTGETTSMTIGYIPESLPELFKTISTQTKKNNSIANDAKSAAYEARDVANATNQHFWTDTDGVHVTDVTQDAWTAAVADGFSDLSASKPYHNSLFNSLGMLFRSALNNLVSITRSAIAFYDGQGNQSSNIVAEFGANGAQVGKTGESHLELDSTSVKAISRTGSAYFTVEDMESAGAIEATETFRSTGGNQEQFTVSMSIGTVEEVTINGTATTNYQVLGNTVTLSTYIGSGKTVAITYKTNTLQAKAFTFGTRSSTGGAIVGPMSVAFGTYNKASGFASFAEGTYCNASAAYSHAEGEYAEASGFASHAEGENTTASGKYAHAEGNQCIASGENSHAQNLGTVAASKRQTAIGTYNVSDSADTYVLIIGNGSGDSSRSNALTVAWNGDVTCHKITCNNINGLNPSNVGSFESNSATVSVSNTTATQICGVTLTAGTWIVIYTASFESNATGRRNIKLYAGTSTTIDVDRSATCQAVNGSQTVLSRTAIVQPTASTTYYLNAYQASGGALSVDGSVQAVRIA